MDKNEKPEYMCPLTLYYMENPAMASDGNIYEKDAIIKWYNQDSKHLSPINRQPLDGKFIEQKQMKIDINEYLINKNIKREEKDLVFDINVLFMTCPKCKNKLKIINKEHRFYRCQSCKQIISLSSPYRIIENTHNVIDNLSDNNTRNNLQNIDFGIENIERRRIRISERCCIM